MSTTLTTEQSYKMADEQEDLADRAIDATLDGLDSRSSSLSELEDAHPMTSPAILPTSVEVDMDNDSEAETKRLDLLTPKARRATLSDGKFSSEKTPSTLSRQLEANSDMENGGSPSGKARLDTVEDAIEDDDILSSSDMGRPSAKKRKRSSSEGSPLSDAMDLDEPARKRPHEEESEPDDIIDHEMDVEEQTVEEIGLGVEPAQGEDTIEEEANVTVEDATDAPAEDIPVDEPVVRRGGLKGRKGVKRRVKRVKNADVTIPQDAEEGTVRADGGGGEAVDAEPEVEAEEEEPGAVDEELTKKRAAMEGLASIEKCFLVFRKRVVNNEINDTLKQMAMLSQADCVHPDYLAQRACIDAHRDKKIRYETTLRKYKLDSLRVKFVAERAQHGSQYAQSVRDTRDKALEECNKRVYAIQRDRRKWGTDERNHLRMYNPDRRQQIKDQTRHNLEVSILSGVAKYVGFPAVPELKHLPQDEIEEDFRRMGITQHLAQPARTMAPQRQSQVAYEPAHPIPASSSAQSLIHNHNPERTAAAEEFYEQTPWANPNHPSHAHHSHNPYLAYATPASQRNNGIGIAMSSGSTIDAHSGPPSSVLASASHAVAGSAPLYPGQNVVEQLNHAARSGPAMDSSPIPIAKRVSSGAMAAGVQPKKEFSVQSPETFEAPRDERNGGLLGQRTTPFAVGVGGGGMVGR